MNVFAQIVDERTIPLVGASVQRLYPNNGTYSSPLLTDINGVVNLPVPDTSYKIDVSFPGYQAQRVLLLGAPNNDPYHPVLIQLQRANYVEPVPAAPIPVTPSPVVVDVGPVPSPVPDVAANTSAAQAADDTDDSPPIDATTPPPPKDNTLLWVAAGAAAVWLFRKQLKIR